MNGWTSIVFEHAAPTGWIVAALLVAVLFAVVSTARLLSFDRLGLSLLAARAAWLLALGWCLWMPTRRESEREALRPRWLVLLDVSASMTNQAGGASVSRWNVARSALEQPWVRAASERCAVDVYPFAEDLRGAMAPHAVAELAPDGARTQLREALRKLVALHRGQPVAGVLVLSDGLDTRESRDEWAAGPWPFPIHAVRIETPGPDVRRAMDVRIDAVETPLRVVVGWNSRLVATLSGETPPDRAISVRLFKNNRLLQEIPTQMNEGGGARDVVFQLDNPAVGHVTYRVEVPPLEGEIQTNDNVSVVSVQVVDAQNRLLYVEDVPRWESRHLVRALRTGGPVTPLAFIRGPDGRFLTFGGRGDMTLDLTPEQLGSFKTVIVGDLDMAALGSGRAEHLAEFVRKGGNLVMLGGPKGWGPAGFEAGPLRPVLPVERREIRPVLEGTFAVEITDEGLAHPVFGGAERFGDPPPVLSVFPGAAPKRGSAVLAQVRTPEGVHPLIVTHRYGQGKAAAILTDSMWRWALAPGEEDFHRRFWHRLLDWLTPEQEDLAPFEVDLFASVSSLPLGESIKLSARVGGPDGAAADVTCAIRTPDGRSLPFRMTPQTITTASGQTLPGFGLSFAPEAPGVFRAVATAEVNGRTADSPPLDFMVRSVSAEATSRPANMDLLRRLAESSGGMFVAPDEIGALVDRLQPEGREEVRVFWRSLWNHWLALGLLLALPALEWTLRRRANMA